MLYNEPCISGSWNNNLQYKYNIKTTERSNLFAPFAEVEESFYVGSNSVNPGRV